jgi:tripartite-type tricarboxylate transporter receptor subunit TctC
MLQTEISRRMFMKKLVSLSLVLLLGASMAFAGGGAQQGAAGADNFPTRPITFLVGFGAGGGMDITARAVQPALERILGVTINIVNRPGANSWIVYEDLARARPDGYTIAMVSMPGIYGYLDPRGGRTTNLDSFQMLANIVTDYCIIITRSADTRFRSIQDIIAHARNNEFTVATAGVGSDDDFMAKSVVRETNVRFTTVPSAGWAEMLPALLGGHVDSVGSNVGEALVAWRNGEVTPWVVFSSERSEFMPNVPTWNESGFGSQITMSSQRGVMMPRGGDPAVVRRLSSALMEAMQAQEVKDRMIQLGLLLDPMDAEKHTSEARRQEAFFRDMAHLIWYD